MKPLHLATLVTAAALLSTPVLAQGTPAPAAPGAPTAAAPMPAPVAAPAGYTPVPDHGSLTADQLIGAALHGPDDADIGKVTDVELGADGRTTGLIADIGGFLGMGSHTVRLGFDHVGVFSNADGRVIAVSSLSEAALKALPAHEKPAN